MMTEAQRIAEQAARMHFAVATSEDREITWFQGPVYRRSMALLKATIKAAYPELSDLKVHRVIDVFQDCQEPISYCVNWVKLNRDSRAYTR